MSALIGHAKAARILGEALKDEAENSAAYPSTAELLHLLGDAHIATAERMEQAMSEEAQQR